MKREKRGLPTPCSQGAPVGLHLPSSPTFQHPQSRPWCCQPLRPGRTWQELESSLLGPFPGAPVHGPRGAEVGGDPSQVGGAPAPPHPSSRWGDEAQVLVQTLSSDVYTVAVTLRWPHGYPPGRVLEAGTRRVLPAMGPGGAGSVTLGDTHLHTHTHTQTHLHAPTRVLVLARSGRRWVGATPYPEAAPATGTC